MKIDFDVPMKDPKGEDFSDKATLGVAVYAALSAPLQTDSQLPSDKRLATYRLLQKVAAGGEQEITVEEAAEIKERSSKTLPIVAFGAVVDMLESAKVATLPKVVNG
ncbi:MAG: hypothetical protein ACREVF_08110 [Burkholderiales bacterium]